MNSCCVCKRSSVWILLFLITLAWAPLAQAFNRQVIGVGATSSAFVKADGTLWTMGDDGMGQVGNGGMLLPEPNPVLVTGDVSSVAVGSFHTLFIKTDGSLWGMGLGTLGALGQLPGYASITQTPVLIAPEAIHVAAGVNSTYFIKPDHTLWALGFNYAGMFGVGNDTNTSTPVLVADNVKAVSVGFDHAVFVKYDGTMWSMGKNTFGQLGNGTEVDSMTPVHVDSNVVLASAGTFSTAWVKTDGSVWNVGIIYEVDPNRPEPSSLTPIQIFEGHTNIEEIGVCAGSISFRTSDLNLYHVGDVLGGSGFNGEPTLMATQVKDLATQAVAPHIMFIKTDGSLWTLGDNQYGQLGDGTFTEKKNPVQVSEGLAPRFGNDFTVDSTVIPSNPGDGGSDGGSDGGEDGSDGGDKGDGKGDGGSGVELPQGGDSAFALLDDLDGDGFADLIMQHPDTGEILLQRFNGVAGRLGTPQQILQSADNIELVYVVDADGDGDKDAVTRTLDGTNLYELRILDRNAVEQERIDFADPGAGVRLLAVYDQNRDGILDPILYDTTTRTIQILYLDASGNIIGRAIVVNKIGVDVPVDVADINGDGFMDVIYQSQDQDEWYMEVDYLDANAYTMNLPERGYFPYLQGYICIGLGDYNTDGNPDVLWQSISTGRVVVEVLNSEFQSVGLRVELLPAGTQHHLLSWQWEFN